MNPRTKILLNLVIFSLTTFHTSAQGSWTTKTIFPGVPREYAVGFSIGTQGYIGTGFADISHVVNLYDDFWEYNSLTNSWTKKSSFPGGKREGAVGFGIGNKGYLGFGRDSSNKYYNDIWEYSPDSDKWTRKADFPGGGRAFLNGFDIGSEGFVGLGLDSNNKTHNDFWEYDPAMDLWSKKRNFPGYSRYGAIGFSIGSKGFIGTGSDTNYDLNNDFWEYEPARNIWHQKASIGSFGRTGSIGFSISNKGYIGLGTINPGGISNDMWEFDTIANQWTQMANCDTSYFGEVGFGIGNNGFICTGVKLPQYGLYSNILWQYQPRFSGVSSMDNTVEFSIYPNPNAGNFTFNSSYTIDCYEIFDINGKLVYRVSKSQFESTINVDLKLSNGVYIVKAINKDGLAFQKFLVGGY